MQIADGRSYPSCDRLGSVAVRSNDEEGDLHGMQVSLATVKMRQDLVAATLDSLLLRKHQHQASNALWELGPTQ